MFPFYKSYSTSSRSDKTMRCGFSLPELVTYSGLAGIVGLFMWSMMNNFTKKQNNLEELNKILIEKNVTVQQISRLLAKSEANPRAYDGSNTVTFTIGDLNFTNQGRLDVDTGTFLNEIKRLRNRPILRGPVLTVGVSGHYSHTHIRDDVNRVSLYGWRRKDS